MSASRSEIDCAGNSSTPANGTRRDSHSTQESEQIDWKRKFQIVFEMVRGVLRDGLKAPNMDIILLLGKESDRIVRKKPADWANERVDLVMYLWLFCGANLLPSGKDWRDLKAGDIWPELKKYWKIGEYGPAWRLERNLRIRALDTEKPFPRPREEPSPPRPSSESILCSQALGSTNADRRGDLEEGASLKRARFS